jgi:hypothetical protein
LAGFTLIGNYGREVEIMMMENGTINLAEIPLGGPDGAIWLNLHGEREEICEELLKPIQPTWQALQHQEQLQAQLRRIDNALDRLMTVPAVRK